ncbi:unnamed protein product [Porites lobata]|uniref:DOMON domain-containing protein n=1 Tax=Porites lobata TaxID=104759 RepID=A0ABN8RD06_9CNID|nr:unnamed protein product [Porites lobata]
MALVALLFLLQFITTFHCTSADLRSEYAHHAVLAEKMRLFWTVDWENETVSFAVEADTTGWVGFGFSTSGHMPGSDVVIGWVKDNKGYLTDRYAVARAVPPIDDQQDYQLTDFKESDGKTLLKFTRKFDTCDSRDKKLEVGAMKIVFAYHSEDPVSPTEVKYHEFRGVKSILLLSSVDTRKTNVTGWKTFNMTARNITIPGNKSTTYWCTLLKAPELKSKHHVTQFVPNIQEGNEGFVHHMLLYECYGNFSEEEFDEGVDCDSALDLPFVQCRFLYPTIAGLAIGEPGVFYPQHVGYALGSSDSPKYFVLETHYDNQRLVQGQKDSSGITLYYTDKLRNYDLGIVAVGSQVNPWFVIPPKQKSWITEGYCMHQCTESMFKNSGLPEGGINVFAAGPHTHMAGRATWTKHVRNGKELPEITRDDHYDFSLAYTQLLRKEINIQPVRRWINTSGDVYELLILLSSDATGPLPNRRAPRPKITEPLPPKKMCPIQSASEGSLARFNILALNLTEPPPHEKTSPNQLESGADMNASFALFFGILNVVIQAFN